MANFLVFPILVLVLTVVIPPARQQAYMTAKVTTCDLSKLQQSLLRQNVVTESKTGKARILTGIKGVSMCSYGKKICDVGDHLVFKCSGSYPEYGYIRTECTQDGWSTFNRLCGGPNHFNYGALAGLILFNYICLTTLIVIVLSYLDDFMSMFGYFPTQEDSEDESEDEDINEGVSSEDEEFIFDQVDPVPIIQEPKIFHQRPPHKFPQRPDPPSHVIRTGPPRTYKPRISSQTLPSISYPLHSRSAHHSRVSSPMQSRSVSMGYMSPQPVENGGLPTALQATLSDQSSGQSGVFPDSLLFSDPKVAISLRGKRSGAQQDGLSPTHSLTLPGSSDQNLAQKGQPLRRPLPKQSASGTQPHTPARQSASGTQPHTPARQSASGTKPHTPAGGTQPHTPTGTQPHTPAHPGRSEEHLPKIPRGFAMSPAPPNDLAPASQGQGPKSPKGPSSANKLELDSLSNDDIGPRSPSQSVFNPAPKPSSNLKDRALLESRAASVSHSPAEQKAARTTNLPTEELPDMPDITSDEFAFLNALNDAGFTGASADITPTGASPYDPLGPSFADSPDPSPITPAQRQAYPTTPPDASADARARRRADGPGKPTGNLPSLSNPRGSLPPL